MQTSALMLRIFFFYLIFYHIPIAMIIYRIILSFTRDNSRICEFLNYLSILDIRSFSNLNKYFHLFLSILGTVKEEKEDQVSIVAHILNRIYNARRFMCIFREKLSIKLVCATLKRRLDRFRGEKVTGWSQSVRTPNKNVFCETLITKGEIYPFNKPYFSMGVA